MDSLIEHFGDVKELRSGKVLYSALGSDKEVAQLFNTIGTDLVPNSQSYLNIRRQIEKQYRNRCKTLITLGCHKYFGNPWSIIALFAAGVSLVLTFIQTWIAIKEQET